MSDHQLKNYGITISKLRKRIEKEAMQAADPDLYPNVIAEREVEILAKIIR